MIDIPSFGPKGDWFALGFICGAPVGAILLIVFAIFFAPEAQADDKPGPDPFDAAVEDSIRLHSRTERARRSAEDLRGADNATERETTAACFRMKQRDGYVNETCEHLLAKRNRTLGIWRAIPECKDDCID